jgi:DNA replication protein DnaD
LEVPTELFLYHFRQTGQKTPLASDLVFEKSILQSWKNNGILALFKLKRTQKGTDEQSSPTQKKCRQNPLKKPLVGGKSVWHRRKNI